MPATQRKNNFRDIRDIFSYILLFAPNFPNRNATLDGEFEQLDVALGELAGRIGNPEVLTLLQQCREVSRETLQLYKEGKQREGILRIQDAQELFVKAGRLRKSKAAAERVEDDYQDD